ncbi:NAD(P)-dependent oxidoreductase [Thalassobacillus sp. B23F22_16]|uniref:NAD(P)-dependent oxidoreductase n=1 Tax=Thalassobacillus sp. B23F22_16 TaxID=3459513 RepID=UPI00373FBF4F
MEIIAVIGCGAMGRGIVKNLVKSGYRVYIYDASEAAVRYCEELGAIPNASSYQAAQQAELVITSLPGPEIVNNVMLGAEGVFAALKPGSFVLDMSTIDPKTAQNLYESAKGQQVHFYDCPLSGGPKGADEGKLTIMVGGDEVHVSAFRPVLDSIGENIFLLGPSGSGQVAKLCHNMLVAVIKAGLGEAMTVGEKAGLSRGQLAEVLQSGSAHNRVLDVFGDNILKNEYENVLFSLAHMSKDIHLYTETADYYQADSPLGQMVSGMYQEALKDGKGNLDSSAICDSGSKIIT